MAGMSPPRWATIYVIIPIFSGFVWLAMLLGMLLWWTVQEDSPHLAPMDAAQDIAYISDIGSHQLQPLFIAMGTVTVVSFTSVFVAERWLRHRGTMVRNTSLFQKILAGLAILFALLGMCGLIVLTCYNNLYHSRTHDVCLVLFMCWVIAFIYALYIWSYAIDFIPAIRTRHYASKETAIDMAQGMERESRMRGYPGGVAQEEAAYRAPGPVGGQQSRNF
ncbi:hypothetical protein BUE80_DR006486 [Diplocarpon rosae]|nr:hypothetical protein BUE80_DR006486 [Diplocarpon rosae]